MKKSKLIVKLAMDKAELEKALLDAGEEYNDFAHDVEANRISRLEIIEEQHKKIEALNGVIKNLRERLDKYMYWISADLQLQPVGDVIYRLKDESGEVVYSTDPNNPEMTVTHYLILTDPDGEK